MGLAAFNRARRMAAAKSKRTPPENPPRTDGKPSGTVTIPDNWRDLPWIPKAGGPSIRSLASSLTDEPIRSKADAIAAIEAELKRRD